MPRLFGIATLALLLVGISADHASGALIRLDGWTTGDERLTRDTATGLDWLDLTTTHEVSIDDLAAGYGGLLALGFRVATEAEVRTLFSATGVILNERREDAYIAAAMLQDLLDCTQCRVHGFAPSSEPYEYVYATLDYAYTQGIVQIGTGFGWGWAEVGKDGRGYVGTSGIPQFSSTSHMQSGSGVYLVRSTPAVDVFLAGADPTPTFPIYHPVPEPSGLSLGLLSLAVLCKRLRQGTHRTSSSS